MSKFSIALVFIFIFSIGTTFGQVSNSEEEDFGLTPRASLLAQMANECVNSRQYSKSQRLRMHPFNTAKGIQLVAFNVGQFLPKKLKDLDVFEFREKVDLHSNQIDELTDILYNVGSDPNIKSEIWIEDRRGCYDPRNGILFLDEKAKAFAYLELCFECHGYRSSNKNIQTGFFCNHKYELLQDFFLKSGIKYVADRKEKIYSWHEILKKDTLDAINATYSKLKQKEKIKGSLDSLSLIERKLMLMINSRTIYDSGLTQFYYNDSGSYLEPTIAILEEIGATKTASALSASRVQWLGYDVPKEQVDRRKLLLEIINNAEPIWKSLVNGLYDQKLTVGGVELSQKEALYPLIFRFLQTTGGRIED